VGGSAFFDVSRRELIALTAAFLCLLPAVTPRLYSSDEIEYFSYLRSIWFDRDVSFENEYQYFYDRDIARAEGFHETFLERETEAGRRPNFGTIGCAILWTPFYAAGDGVARMLRASGRPVPIDGLSQPYVAAVAYASAFYGFLAVLLSIAVARRALSTTSPDALHAASRVAAVVVWAGTPLVFYMYVAPPMSHACSAFAVALFVAIWLHVRGSWTPGQTALLGAAAALMAMVREQDVFFAIGPAIDFLLTARTRRPERRAFAASALSGSAAFAAAFAPQLLAYKALNGHFGPSRLVTRKMSWSAPHALDVLASTSHGFFFWTPLAVLAIAGLVLMTLRAPADARRVGAVALFMTALQVYVGGSVQSWDVAGAFGQRRFVALTVLLVLGLTALLVRAWHPPARRAAVTAAAAVCVWWNLALIAQFATRMMDRKRLEPARNAYHAFVTIPRMAPALAARYFGDRASFYRTPPGEGR
jgi:hypothetical protein